MPLNINLPFFLSNRTQILFRVAICPGKRIFSQKNFFFLVNEMPAKVLVLGKKIVKDC